MQAEKGPYVTAYEEVKQYMTFRVNNLVEPLPEKTETETVTQQSEDANDITRKAQAEFEGVRETDGVKVEEVSSQSPLPTASENLNPIREEQTQEQLKQGLTRKYEELEQDGLSEAVNDYIEEEDAELLSLHNTLENVHDAYLKELVNPDSVLASELLSKLGDSLQLFQKAKQAAEDEKEKDEAIIEENDDEMEDVVNIAASMEESITPKFKGLIKTFKEAKSEYEKANLKFGYHKYKAMIKAQGPLKEAATALAAGKEEYEKENAAKAKIEKWKKTHDHQLQDVATYEQATPAIRTQLRQLRPLKLQFDTQVDAQSYAKAAEVLDKLGPVVTTLHEMKGEYDKAIEKRSKVDVAWQAIKVDFDQANGMNNSTKDSMELKTNLQEEEQEFDKLYNHGEYDQALKQIKRVKVAVEAVLALNDSSDYLKAEQKAKNAEEEYKKVKDRLEKALAIPKTLEKIKPLRKALKQLDKEYINAFSAGEFDVAIGKAQQLGAAKELNGLLELKEAAKERDLEKKKVDSMYSGLETDLDEALDFEPLTPDNEKDLSVLKDTKDKYLEAYNTCNYEAAEGLIQSLSEAIKAIQEYKTGTKREAYDKAVTEMNQVYDKVIEAYPKLDEDVPNVKKKCIHPYTSNLIELRKNVDDAVDNLNENIKLGKGDEAMNAAKKLDDAIKAMNSAQTEYDDEHAAKKAECEKEWNEHVKGPYELVKDFEPLTEELKKQLGKLPNEFKAYENTFKKQCYIDALKELKNLRLTVQALKELENDHTAAVNKAKQDSDDCKSEANALDNDAFNDAFAMLEGWGALDLEMVEAFDNFKAKWGKYRKLFLAGKREEAKVLLQKDGTLHKAAKELAAKKDLYEFHAGARKSLTQEWNKIKPNYDKVSKFKPFTEQFKILLVNLTTAYRNYAAEVADYQDNKALAMLQPSGALFEAVKALLDVENDQISEVSKADSEATTAASEIDNATDKELKELDATAQVKLLKRLRSRMTGLTDDEKPCLAAGNSSHPAKQ